MIEPWKNCRCISSIIIAFAIHLFNLSTMLTRSRFQRLWQVTLWSALAALLLYAPARSGVAAQSASPTPTGGTTDGMFITVISTEPQINVRGGPGSVAYPVVGFILQGGTAPALGRSPGGDWIQIEYPGAPGGVGWVYSPLVAVSPGFLQIIEPPPTPIPPPTNTIDPTLAAQFDVAATATRLPTFTPPAASIVPPSFEAEAPRESASSLPLGILILTFASVGSAAFLFSLAGRR